MGTSYPTNEGWAVFRVQLNLAIGQSVALIDTARIAAAINFFKPVRAWLDSLWFVGVPIVDEGPMPLDVVVSIFSRTDSAPVPHDVIAAPGWPEDDIKLIVPLYDRHFLHSGITYGLNEPAVADSGVTVNGVAIAAKY